MASSSTGVFSPTGQRRAFCIEVHDGDSFTAYVETLPTGDPVLDRWPAYRRCKIRLAGYNAPEISTGGKPAQDAKIALSGLVLLRETVLVVHGLEKYGRVLATVLVNGADIVSGLIDGGHGTKMRLHEQMGGP